VTSLGSKRRWLRPALLLLGLHAGTVALTAQGAAYLGEPVRYEDPEREDRVAELVRALESGSQELDWDERRGWLPALLEAVNAPVESQVLVFSKTSRQDAWISPHTPRAIYFSDDVFVGWIPGAPMMELTALDPVQGPTFYVLDQRPERPVITRRDEECLQCHATSRTYDWPGNLVRSVHPDEAGAPIYRSGTHTTTQASPLVERWGGWYVSGTHGRQRHMGNVVVGPNDDDEQVDVSRGANVTDLSELFDVERYPSPHSDLVALMVLEHQAGMQNILARASYEGRIAQTYQRELNELSGKPEGTLSDSTARRYARLAADVVDHMLFRGETRLTEPIAGTSEFVTRFAARGKRDSKGRSLRDFDLGVRIFKHPCSYLIHSPAFDRLPEPVLEIVWQELWDVLNDRDIGRDFSHLSPKRRRAILEILLETKVGLPGSWRLPALAPVR